MRLFLTCTLLIFTLLAGAQPANRIDKHGRRQGRWITYYDDAKTIPCFRGRFRNDRQVGRAYHYLSDGTLERRETEHFGRIKTRFYYPDGRLRKKGNARIVVLPEKIHYYFYGRWKTYDEAGKLIKTETYSNGELVKTEYNKRLYKLNDKLRDTLVAIDREFAKWNNSLADSLNHYRKDALKCVQFKRELALRDSVCFVELFQILVRHGYPTVQEVADASPVPFYILGFAPVPIKELCLPYFIKAADHGDIEWKSLAFFIDKLRVAKGEKQVYGTQFYYDKNEKEVIYPVEDPDNLPLRRQQAGFVD
ncbi:MAG: hypothetical protein JST26_17350 [Bacteroidetes bacterium]|nr:hypothetical protein [Bacteroidota bacterium]